MTNSESIDQNNQVSNAVRAAELAVLGEVLSKIGDMISTIAAALEEVGQSENDNKNMQKQIDYLINEVKKLNK